MKIVVNALVHLSEFRSSDKDAIIAHLNDREICVRTLRIPFPYTDASADEWLALTKSPAAGVGKLLLAMMGWGRREIGVVSRVAMLRRRMENKTRLLCRWEYTTQQPVTLIDLRNPFGPFRSVVTVVFGGGMVHEGMKNHPSPHEPKSD